MGTADNSACEYGCSGSAYTCAVSASSTILPRYMMATLWLMWRTTLRSCEMKRYVSCRLLLQVLQEIDDLRLHGDVQGGDRLVGHDEVGVQDERTSDGDALTLAAAELVRVAAHERGLQPHLSQHLRDPLPPFGPCPPPGG